MDGMNIRRPTFWSKLSLKGSRGANRPKTEPGRIKKFLPKLKRLCNGVLSKLSLPRPEVEFLSFGDPIKVCRKPNLSSTWKP